MRFDNKAMLNAVSASGNSGSTQMDASNLFCASLQGILTGTGLGTLKLRGSNDVGTPMNARTVSNWSDIGTVSVTGAGVFLVPKLDLAYQWIQAYYLDLFVRIITATAIADVAGALAGKYFKLDSAGGGKRLIYFKVGGVGADPAIVGYTSVEVAFVDDSSAATIATAIHTAMGADAIFTSANPSSGVVTFTDKTAGPGTAVADGTVPLNSGFTLALTEPTGTMTANVKASGF